MANAFNKEERVAFEQLLEGFQDALVLSNNVSTYRTDQTMMERTSDVVWRPMPYISESFDGMDQTANFRGYTQLSVPATIGFSKSVPFVLDAKELRDALQEGRLGDSAKQKLASDINVAIMNVASQQSTLVVRRTGTQYGFDDVANCEAVMNEIGVAGSDRTLALSTRDYNKLARDLANRQHLAPGKTLTAYERAFVGMVASFETFKMDYANRLTAAVPGAGVSINGANQFYVPRATSTASTGERNNVDNRYQVIAVTVGAGGALKVGDAFTIAGVNSVHHITKRDTGQPKTFRITRIVTGGGTAGANTIEISPPIISAQGASDAEESYKNVTATPAGGAPITFLNTAAAYVNPFWHKDALEILPGRYAVPTDSGAAVMRGTTDNGVEMVMQKFYDINTMKTKFRVDVLFGVVNKQPEMTGILLLDQ